MADPRRRAFPFIGVCAFTAAALAAYVLVPAADAASSRPAESATSIADRMNANTLAVISGNVNGTYLTIAYDLAAVLNDGDNLRILPVIGHGGGHNIRDVRYLRGIDLGITQAGILDSYRRNGTIGNIDDKITYISKLFNEELHIVVRSDSGISSIEELRGRPVSFNELNSNTDISGRDIMRRLGIETQALNMGQADGLQALKTGRIAAMMQMTGKPTGAIANIKANDGLRLLPVPFAKPLQDVYLPTSFTSQDYPQIIRPGEQVDAIAANGILIAYNWPKNTDRYRRIEKFIDAFFPRIEEFWKPPRHPKWKEASIIAKIPGLKRFPAAEEWLDRNVPKVTESGTRVRFEEFLASRGMGERTFVSTPGPDRDRLFEEFLKWQNERGRR